MCVGMPCPSLDSVWCAYNITIKGSSLMIEDTHYHHPRIEEKRNGRAWRVNMHIHRNHFGLSWYLTHFHFRLHYFGCALITAELFPRCLQILGGVIYTAFRYHPNAFMPWLSWLWYVKIFYANFKTYKMRWECFFCCHKM